MVLREYFAGACTTTAIENLGNAKNALAAMKTFCKLQLGVLEKDSKYGRSQFEIPTTYIVWTAGPEEPGHGHSKAWVKYGTEFAQFIQENSLGIVLTLGPALNVRHHPKTTCQFWVWQPDANALKAWWGKCPEAGKTRDDW